MTGCSCCCIKKQRKDDNTEETTIVDDIEDTKYKLEELRNQLNETGRFTKSQIEKIVKKAIKIGIDNIKLIYSKYFKN